jgi:hypothetical protein
MKILMVLTSHDVLEVPPSIDARMGSSLASVMSAKLIQVRLGR